MYALSSRDSLSQRQQRWTKDNNATVQNIPDQQVLDLNFSSDSIRTEKIISDKITDSQDDSFQIITSEDLKYQETKNLSHKMDVRYNSKKSYSPGEYTMT
jgi:hypothetical protein